MAFFTLLIGWYGLVCIGSNGEGSFLDRADLVAHEAGHQLFGHFGHFGQFVMVAGGTLGQILAPAGIIAFFAGRRELFSSCAEVYFTSSGTARFLPGCREPRH